jgi:cupin 2 domain-containing protein
MDHGNLWDAIPGAAAAAAEVEEEFTDLLRRDAFRVERIVSRGHASPPGFWYDQEGHEWVMVVQGRAGLEIEGEPEVRELGPGDWVDIPARTRHRVAWTQVDPPTLWLAIHYG